MVYKGLDLLGAQNTAQLTQQLHMFNSEAPIDRLLSSIEIQLSKKVTSKTQKKTQKREFMRGF